MAGGGELLSWVGRALTAVAGVLWLAQGFLPMVSSGAFSNSTTLDLVRMSVSGALGMALPGGASAALLAVPASGVLLFALAPWDASWSRWLRAVVIAAGGLSVLLLVLILTGADLSYLGPGAICALAGLALALIGVALVWAARRAMTPVDEAEVPYGSGPPNIAALASPDPAPPYRVSTDHVSPAESVLTGESKAPERAAQEVGER